jgi:hypothetical protein
MNHSIEAVDNNKELAIRWLCEVLSAIVDNTVLPQRIKQKTARLIRCLPDWYLSRWAAALNIDFMKGYREYPDLAGKAGTDEGKGIMQRYLDGNNAAVMIDSLKKLVADAVRLNSDGRLPCEGGTVERQVCALALNTCTEEGNDFARAAENILGGTVEPGRLLEEYRLALERADKEKTDRLHAVLNGHPYGKWVTERLDEAKRWLGLDEPVVRIKRGPRTPLWELFWQEFFTGGDNGTNSS